MRQEIRRIVDTLKITTVYVTHDQDEALSLADGMAVLKSGRVIQVGAPREMYRRPCNRFVADFLGDTNFLPAVFVRGDSSEAVYRTAAGELASTAAPFPKATELSLSLRPEALRIVTGARGASRNRFEGTARSGVYLGGVAQHEVVLDAPAGAAQPVLRVSELNPKAPIAPGQRVAVEIDADDVVPLAS
jgi:ABC-type Fe3+/spermidine/putrescine transport system ATPase subunit